MYMRILKHDIYQDGKERGEDRSLVERKKDY